MLCAAARPERPAGSRKPLTFNLGPVVLRPSGFFDYIAEYRSATTLDTISTNFGGIPLRTTPGETLASPGHSLLSLKAETSLAAVVHAGPRVGFVSQQLWSQGGGPDVLGCLPRGVHAHATIQGVEAKVLPTLEVFSYGGLVYGTRSAGNRTVRQWSAGFRQKLFTQAGYGAAYLMGQYSQLDRALWSGPRGAMNFVMLGFRYYMPPQ